MDVSTGTGEFAADKINDVLANVEYVSCHLLPCGTLEHPGSGACGYAPCQASPAPEPTPTTKRLSTESMRSRPAIAGTRTA